MHKDANLRKRNALAIPGGLLAFYSLAGMAYVALARTATDSCEDPSLIVFAGACRSAVLVMGIPLVLGLALVLIGAFAFRSRATCRHGHGSWTHFTLALLISLIVVPAAGIGLAPSLVGEGAAIARGGVDYPVTSILAGVAGLGVLMLIPFAFLYAGQVRANPCCREKGCFAPCFCDEPAGGELPPEEPPAEAPAAAAAAAPSEAPPPASDDWTVVDEPAPTPPPPAPAPPAETPEENPPSTTATATTLAGAPPLASRPSDPAAPPSDEMAHAVEWAQVDEDDEDADLGDDEPEAASAKPAPKRRKAAGKTAARPAKKKTSKPKKS